MATLGSWLLDEAHQAISPEYATQVKEQEETAKLTRESDLLAARSRHEDYQNLVTASKGTLNSPQSEGQDSPISTAGVQQKQDQQGAVQQQQGVAPTSIAALGQKLSGGNSPSAADATSSKAPPITDSPNGGSTVSEAARVVGSHPDTPDSMKAAIASADSPHGNVISAATNADVPLPYQVDASNKTYQSLLSKRTPQMVADALLHPLSKGDALKQLDSQIALAKEEVDKHKQGLLDGESGVISRVLNDVATEKFTAAEGAKHLHDAFTSYYESDMLRHPEGATQDPKAIHQMASQKADQMGIPKDGSNLESWGKGVLFTNEGTKQGLEVEKGLDETNKSIAEVKMNKAKADSYAKEAELYAAKVRQAKYDYAHPGGEKGADNPKLADAVKAAGVYNSSVNSLKGNLANAQDNVDSFNENNPPPKANWFGNVPEDTFATQRAAYTKSLEAARKEYTNAVGNQTKMNNILMGLVGKKYPGMTPPPDDEKGVVPPPKDDSYSSSKAHSEALSWAKEHPTDPRAIKIMALQR